MKLDKPSSKLKQVKGLDGLITVTFEHEIKSSTAIVDCKLPKIDPAEWNRVLAFLAWSYQHTHSEAQLRAFLNIKTRQWRFWAFPQICGTGMTTKEIAEASPERDAQRAQFGDAEGWCAFGTIHHHCSASAFQSGTDEADEILQDGLHITVGHMDQKQYDIHCRFYIGGNRFDPDMSLFWDLGDVFGNVPDWIMRYVPQGVGNELARKAMCFPAPENTAFPDEWKANLIEQPKAIVTTQTWTPRGGTGFGNWDRETRQVKRNGVYQTTTINTDYDFKHALQKADELFAGGMAVTLEDVANTFEEAQIAVEQSGVPLMDVFEFCIQNDITLEAFNEWLQNQLALQQGKELELEMQAEGGAAPQAEVNQAPLGWAAQQFSEDDWRLER
jgi:hypothetical protein